MAIQRDKVITNAEKLVAKGKIEPAIKEYERLLDDNPNDVNTLNRIGDLWVRINRNDEAVKVFGRIADHYSKDGFFLKAIAIFKKINKLDPSKLDVYSKLADLYAKQGLAMEAKSQYQVLADYYQKHGDPGNALATYRKIADLDPNSINVHVKLADLYSQNNQSAEALKEYDRVGKMLLKRGMLDEALQVFRKALKIDSGNVDLAESVVTTLLEAKDFNSAIQLIESTLETNKQNPKLVSLLGRTQVAKGDLAAARGVLEKGVSNNPTDAGLREALADLYLRQGSPDQALSTVSPLIDSLLAKSDRSAIEHLNRIVKAEPLHIPTLEKLVQAYTKLREETNIVMALNSLTEAHIARKSFEEATSTLQELIKREPENAQHRKKLAFVRQSTGEAPEPQMAESSYAPPLGESFPDLDLPSAELYELDMSSPESEISFDLDASESMGGTDLGGSGFGMDTSAMESEGVLDQPGAEDLDFITEHMTEAEVFAKYGLSEKAIEHLRVVLGRSPQNVEAHEKLLRIYLDEGDHDNTQEVAGEYLSILRDLGDESAAAAVRAQLTARGYAISEGASVTVRFGGAAAVPGPAAAPAVSKPAPPSPRAATPAPKPPSRPAPPPPPPVAPEPEEIPMEFALSEMEEPEVELDLDAMTGEEEY
ncbi:MAG TPA: tetratricopeptide repeat protein, partial [Thermoanaerobaculia bacterium]|nr:tetratricopeptide repeat protein [Thermoanaerobaculia bacterium]